MNPNLIAFLILLVISFAVPTALFLLLRASLCGLLSHTIKLQAGITFYLRSFLLVLYLAALSGAIGISFDLKPDSRFMEYVWKGATGVSSSFQSMVCFVAVYLVLITVLVATLKVKVDELSISNRFLFRVRRLVNTGWHHSVSLSTAFFRQRGRQCA